MKERGLYLFLAGSKQGHEDESVNVHNNMRKLTPRLTNCYIPQPYRPDTDDDSTQLQRKEQELLSHRNIYNSNNGSTMYHNYKSIPVNQRKTHELRKLRLESNVIPSTSSNSNSYISGSAMIELGRTKVICTVVGPVTSNCPVVPSSMTLSMDRGTVQVQVSYLAHQASMPSHHIPVNAIANNPNMMDVVAHSGSATASKNASPSQQQPILNPKQCQKYIQDQEHDLSLRIQRAISSVILLEQYPKCAIVLQFLILFNDDANIVATCLNVASLALASAQIEMYGVVTASTVATVTMATTPQSLSSSLSNRNDDDMKNKNSGDEEVVVLLADPTRDEMSLADSMVMIHQKYIKNQFPRRTIHHLRQ